MSLPRRQRCRTLLVLTALAAVVLSLHAPAFGQTRASDTFERATLGTNWGTRVGNVGIVGNSDLGQTAAGGMCLAAWTGSAIGSDQFSEATISNDVASTMLVQVFGRRRAGDGARYGFHYDGDPNDNSSGLNAWQIKFDGVPTAQTRILASNPAWPAPRPGDSIRIEVRGTGPVQVRGYVNGVLVLIAVDSASNRIVSGPPGIVFRPRVGTSTTYPTAVVEQWSGGDLSS